MYLRTLIPICACLTVVLPPPAPCSAKVLVKGEPNVSYICSRYYRAPELIFGATDYTCDIGKTSWVQLVGLCRYYSRPSLIWSWPRLGMCNGRIYQKTKTYEYHNLDYRIITAAGQLRFYMYCNYDTLAGVQLSQQCSNTYTPCVTICPVTINELIEYSG